MARYAMVDLSRGYPAAVVNVVIGRAEASGLVTLFLPETSPVSPGYVLQADGTFSLPVSPGTAVVPLDDRVSVLETHMTNLVGPLT